MELLNLVPFPQQPCSQALAHPLTVSPLWAESRAPGENPGSPGLKSQHHIHRMWQYTRTVTALQEEEGFQSPPLPHPQKEKSLQHENKRKLLSVCVVQKADPKQLFLIDTRRWVGKDTTPGNRPRGKRWETNCHHSNS